MNTGSNLYRPPLAAAIYSFHIITNTYIVNDINMNNNMSIDINTTSRSLNGGGSGVCIYFVYVYRVLRFAALLRMSLELILLALE